jgi:hypothetical protein
VTRGSPPQVIAAALEEDAGGVGDITTLATCVRACVTA